MLTHAQNDNGNMISCRYMLGNYVFENACYLNTGTDVTGDYTYRCIQHELYSRTLVIHIVDLI